MVFRSPTVRHSAPVGERWLPGLGVLLTGCGVGLLSAGAGGWARQLILPMRPSAPR
jgi:hypothetical protein